MSLLGTPGFLQLMFGFPTTGSTDQEYLRVKYLDNVLGNSQLIRIDYKSTSGLVLSDTMALSLEQSVADQALALQEDPGTDPTNIYIQRFVDSYSAADAQGRDLVHQEFPKAYASLVQNMVEYLLENGAFDAATLQSLQLFHVNTDCPEGEVADFLDIQGILEQITREYAEQACNDRDVSLRDKLRRALKFGLMLLYIQLSISEFIIKNIFVFAALTLDRALNDRDGFLFIFFRKRVKQSLIKFLSVSTAYNPDIISLPPSFRPENMEAIKKDLIAYFNKKIGRETVIANGGIRYTQEPSDVAFPPGTYFTSAETTPSYITGPRATFDDILDYLIAERLFFSRVPINNALKKALDKAGKTPRPMNEALIASYPLLRSARAEPESTQRVRQAARLIFGDAPNIFVLDEADVDPPANKRRSIYSLWFYTGATVSAVATEQEEPPMHAFPSQPGDGRAVQLLSRLYTRTFWVNQSGEEISAPALGDVFAPGYDPWDSIPGTDPTVDVVVTDVDGNPIMVNVNDLRSEIIEIFGAPGQGTDFDISLANNNVPAVVIATQTHIPHDEQPPGPPTGWTSPRIGTYTWRIVGVTADGEHSAATSITMAVEMAGLIQFTIAYEPAHAHYRIYRERLTGVGVSSAGEPIDFVAEIPASTDTPYTVITDDYFPIEIYEYFNPPDYTTSYWVFDWLPGGLNRWEEQYAEENPSTTTFQSPDTQNSPLQSVHDLDSYITTYLASNQDPTQYDLLVFQMSELGINMEQSPLT